MASKKWTKERPVAILSVERSFFEGGINMAVARRKDSKKRVLKEGEYERANGTFEFKWRDKRGKRHSVYAKTLEELREKENDARRDDLDGIRSGRKNLTINDLFNLWRQIKRGLRDNTFQNYCYMYSMFVEPDFGLTHIQDLKRTDVRAFYNYLTDERGLKANTVDNVHTVLHQVLELGVEDEYLRYNPSDNALRELRKAHNSDTEKKHALTLQEQELFEEYLSRPGQYQHWGPIFTLMLWTGMRVGEVTGLRWCDIDLDEGIIDVNHTLIYYDKRDGNNAGCRFAVNDTKTFAGRRQIPMLPKVKAAFLEEKQRQEDFGIKCNVSVDGYTDFIFVNRFGKTQHQGTLNKALRRIIRDCNYAVLEKAEEGSEPVLLPRFSNHILRHTFTTRMCEAGVNIKAMQDILGHADAETTMNIYADATKDLKRTEMLDFEQFFNEQKKKQETA